MTGDKAGSRVFGAPIRIVLASELVGVHASAVAQRVGSRWKEKGWSGFKGSNRPCLLLVDKIKVSTTQMVVKNGWNNSKRLYLNRDYPSC
jgi:hypothetical protein